MDLEQSSETSDTTTVAAAVPTTCPFCEDPLVFERGDGVCDSCSMDVIYHLQRVSDYARALERNGVAAGTIKALRSIHLEEDDLFGGGADMPANRTSENFRSGDDEEGR